MSFTNDATPQLEVHRQVTDVRALRALAHPLRLAILHHLMAFGAQTASQCAQTLGSTASNCSYHLRSLARFGLVESVEPTDGRERPWRSVATGLQFGARPGEPVAIAAGAAESVLAQQQLEEHAMLARRVIAGRDEMASEWRNVVIFAVYSLRISPAELNGLGAKLDALIRPYIALTREDAPEDSNIVNVELDAFLHPDAPR